MIFTRSCPFGLNTGAHAELRYEKEEDMKTILLAVVLCLYSQAVLAFTIATGLSDGTYFQIAQDIKNLVAEDGIELQISSTKGSLENIQLLGNGKVDLAIVQLDALRFVSDAVKQQGLDVFDKIKVVLNLYPEEIHVLSNKKEIQSFYHLEGKRVSVGTEGSGSAVSAAVLFTVYDSTRLSPSTLLKTRLRGWMKGVSTR